MESSGQTVVTEDDLFYLPIHSEDPVYHKKHYSLAYSEEHEQASWVAYTLTLEHLNAQKVARRDYFTEDPQILSKSSSFYDYKGSGYTKGHLVPAADRAYSGEAMEETFLMSNISPQTRALNGGIWRELEEQVRDWARKHHQLYVVCGPIFAVRPKKIGQNRVSIPDAFYKAVLTGGDVSLEGVGFVIPNEKSTKHLSEYMVTIDQIEELTGLDLWADLLSNAVEEQLESSFNKKAWKFNDRRFKRRLEKWNNQ